MGELCERIVYQNGTNHITVLEWLFVLMPTKETHLFFCFPAVSPTTMTVFVKEEAVRENPIKRAMELASA